MKAAAVLLTSCSLLFFLALACGGGSEGDGGAGGQGTGGGTTGGSDAGGGADSGTGGGGTGANTGTGGAGNQAGVDGGEAGAASGGTGGGTGGSGGSGNSGNSGGEGGASSSGPNIVFVSSLKWAPQALGGLEGADEKCQALADAADLPGTFVAWLSDSKTDAKDRLGSARGWVRTDGKPFVDTVADLTSGTHFYSPQLDENATKISDFPAPVVTGTAADGTKYAPFGGYCGDYQEPDASFGVTRGDLNFFDDRWTVLGQFVGDMQPCNSPARLYCFQIDHQKSVEAGFPASRKAFVTKGSPRPDMGIDEFDDQCAAEALAAKLPGSFKAFVSSTTEAAASRFDLTGLTFARMDGVPIVESAADIADATSLDVPIDQHADGTTIENTNQHVYTGSVSPSTVATDAESCDNWTISFQDNYARVGNPTLTNASWWNDLDDRQCNNWVRVYCFEE